MFTLNDIPKFEMFNGQKVALTEQTRNELLEQWNQDLVRIANDQSNYYKQVRRENYPSIGDQLDSLFKAGVFPDEMAAKIQAVKDEFPKDLEYPKV